MLRFLLCVYVFLAAAPIFAQNNYPLTADSQRKEGVPQGKVTHYTFKSTGTIFPGTVRDYWVYIPAQYKSGDKPALMVFQDGGGYQSADGGVRLPLVFDNLIADGSMPPTVAVMVNPGVVPPENEATQLPRFNRSVEYDSTNGDYAAFLEMEFLPAVEKQVGITFTKDPAFRGVGGASSGGSCSFTAAWTRPDLFGKVFCTIGSFTDLRGAHNYPTLVRKHERKPIRVYMQDGSNDQNIYAGSWWMANQDLALALDWAGYDSKFVTGDGGHDGRQAAQIFPDALRFLWREWKTGAKPVPHGTNQRIYELVSDESQWESVSIPYPTVGLTADKNGEIITINDSFGTLMRVNSERASEQYRPGKYKADVVLYAADDRIFGIRRNEGDISTWDKNGKETVIFRKTYTRNFTVSVSGDLYYNKEYKIVRQNSVGKVMGTIQNYGENDLFALTPDQSLLLAVPTGSGDKIVNSYRVLSGGGIVDKQKYHDLQFVYGDDTVGVNAMTHDTNGWLYIATRAGIQICDQAGRVNAVLSPPAQTGIADMVWGGKNREYLYIRAHTGRIYKRKMKVRGINPCDAPVKPPAPRL